MTQAANAPLVSFELVGLSISIAERRWKIFAYYTQISNILALASAMAFLLLGEAAAALRYLSTCMLAMTFLISLCVLSPFGGGFKEMMLSDNKLYHHTLCPIISLVSYVLWEPHGGTWVAPVAVTTVYGLAMLYLNYLRRFDGPYPFFRVHDQSVLASVLWTLALMALMGGLSIGIDRL